MRAALLVAGLVACWLLVGYIDKPTEQQYRADSGIYD